MLSGCGIAGHAGAGRDGIASQEVSHGYMITPRPAWVLGLAAAPLGG